MVVNNQISPDYASKSVVIVGYDNPSNIAANRKTRYYAADPNSPVTLPHLMVDSGRQTSRGGTTDQNYYNQKIRSMIDSELNRPPQAALSAKYKRVGSHLEFTISVTNQSGVALSSSNKAAVHAVAYETFTNATRPSYALVNNFGRVTAYKAFTQSLANGATGAFSLVTTDLPSDVNWANLHMLVMVDYLPPGSSGAYDMLQAAFAKPAEPTYSIVPAGLGFMVESGNLKDQTKRIQITSSSPTLAWAAAASAGWVALNPASGIAGTPLSVTVSAGKLEKGKQSSAITIQLTDVEGFARTVEVPVVAYLGEIHYFYLPSTRR